MPSTVRTIAKPGKMAIQGAVVRIFLGATLQHQAPGRHRLLHAKSE